jgi:UDP:flavonoid glycosyltransferase YjiC (YdhE family)
MRVLFTSTAGWGHIHPMVPLARALVDRGIDVLWAAPPAVCERLERAGVPTRACGLTREVALREHQRVLAELQSVTPASRTDAMFRKMFAAVLAPAMIADLEPVARAWSPQLVVSDQAEFAGAIAAAVIGVPSVTHSYGSLRPAGLVAAAADEVAHLWTERGLEARPYGGRYDHLYIDIYPPSLQDPHPPHVGAVQPLRPGDFATDGDEDPPGWLTDASADPLLYITFGTAFTNGAVLTTVIQAVRNLPVPVVVTVGPNGDPASLGPQPANVHVARYIPHSQLLPHCSAVVSHGGSGTFLATLGAAAPQLFLPQGADQFFNAAACERSGVGLAVQPDCITHNRVRHAVERLLFEAGFRDAAHRLSGEVASMPAPPDVAAVLESTYG